MVLKVFTLKIGPVSCSHIKIREEDMPPDKERRAGWGAG
jgi:hypothetical protein